ncbi:hypothetical protein, conserved, partial [Eimeria acervulina]
MARPCRGFNRAPTRLSLLIGGFSCLFFSLFLLPVSAIMFDLPPQTRECFFVKTSKQESDLTGSYQSFFGDGSIRLTVEGPVPAHRANAQMPPLTPIFSSVEEAAHIQAA